MPGLARVVNADDPVFPAYFEPGKLRHWTLEHRLLNQRVRLALEEKGGTGWLNGDRGAFMAQYPGVRHRPDGVVTLSSGAIVAVETERSLKTRPANLKATLSRSNRYCTKTTVSWSVTSTE